MMFLLFIRKGAEHIRYLENWMGSDYAQLLQKSKNSIEEVSEERIKWSSYINQLTSIITNLDCRNLNLQSSKSTIVDANMAKNQILQQTSATLLQQVNQASSIALKIVNN